MVPYTPDKQPSANSVRQQHERLESLLEVIGRRFLSDTRPNRSLVSLIKALAVHLQTHFEWEESGGYFSGVMQRDPSLADTVERLLREHGIFLSEVEELVTLARATLNGGSMSELSQRFARFRSELSAHEHEENRLLQESYTLDMGTKD